MSGRPHTSPVPSVHGLGRQQPISLLPSAAFPDLQARTLGEKKLDLCGHPVFLKEICQNQFRTKFRSVSKTSCAAVLFFGMCASLPQTTDFWGRAANSHCEEGLSSSVPVGRSARKTSTIAGQQVGKAPHQSLRSFFYIRSR